MSYCVDAIIKHAFNILETSPDNREKMQAMELFEDIHLVKMELLYTATTIDSALHYSESSSNLVVQLPKLHELHVYFV